MKITRHANGVFYATVLTAAGSRRLSLKTRNEADAHRVARDSKLAELEAAAKVNALTAETVARIVTGRSMSGADVFAAWSDWLQLVGLAPNTRAQYQSHVRQFLRESGFETRALAGLNERHVDAFVNPRDDIVANTRRSRLAALSSLFGYTHAKGFTIGNPASLVRVRLSGLSFHQKEATRRVPFTDAEMVLLRSIESPFWSTFVLLGENFGLRLSDVAQLERACIAKPGVIIIWTDKRDRRLELPLDAKVREHLEALESCHASLFFPREAAIVADPKRRAIVSVEFARLLRRLGIAGKSAHCLRNTFASKRAEMGQSIDEIRQQLGHASARTTTRYVDVL
jgi:integrase